MLDIEELRLARMFPFSVHARRIVREENFAIDNIPRVYLDRAGLIVLECSKNNNSFLVPIKEHSDFLKAEVLAFPVSKLLLAGINLDWLSEKFARFFAESVVLNMEKCREKNEKFFWELLFDFCPEFELNFAREEKPFFASVQLIDFLQTNVSNDRFKLVNLPVFNGRVFFSQELFLGFFKERVFWKTFLSIKSINSKELPRQLKLISNELHQSINANVKRISSADFSGSIAQESFPPCMNVMFNELLEHKKLSHFQRFDLAAFFSSINAPLQKILELYKNLPDFNEKITSYQLKRIVGTADKKISCPGCEKIKEHGLCYKTIECEGIFHPVGFYKRKLLLGKKAKKLLETDLENKKQ